MDALNRHKLENINFESAPLRDLITMLAHKWRTYYCLKGMHRGDGDEFPEFTSVRQELEDPDWWIEQFNRARDEPNWPENDIVPDQFPAQSKRVEHRIDERAGKMNNIAPQRRMEPEKAAELVANRTPLARRSVLRQREDASKPAVAGTKRTRAESQDAGDHAGNTKGRKTRKVIG